MKEIQVIEQLPSSFPDDVFTLNVYSNDVYQELSVDKGIGAHREGNGGLIQSDKYTNYMCCLYLWMEMANIDMLFCHVPYNAVLLNDGPHTGGWSG